MPFFPQCFAVPPFHTLITLNVLLQLESITSIVVERGLGLAFLVFIKAGLGNQETLNHVYIVYATV